MKKFIKFKNAIFSSSIALAIGFMPMNQTQASFMVDVTETLTPGTGYVSTPIISQLLPGIGLDFLESLNISDLINGFNSSLRNIFATEVIGEILNSILEGEFQCPDSEEMIFPIFAPLEPGWCSILPNGDTIGEILRDNQGALNLPIPSRVQELVRRAISETHSDDALPELSDPFQTNSQIQANLNSNAADRIQTQVAIESVLGERGQQTIEQQFNSQRENLTKIAEQANLAFEATSTQDVMKNIAKMLARDSVISATISSEITRLRIDSQYTNSNLTNVSRTLDQNLRRSLVNDSLNQSRLMYLTSQSFLW
jgi:hypothetical protein